MSRENTEFDVRVALYDGSKNPLANIVFFNDTELLLECKRVVVVRDGNRLYFHKGDSVQGSVKISGRDNDRLQLWSDYSKVRDLEGRYDLKYDKDQDIYYIDKTEKLSDDDIRLRGTRKGLKQLNHNPGNRGQKGDLEMTVAISKTKKTPTSKQPNIMKMVNKKDETNEVVVKALLELLKTQVVGNDNAINTIKTLEQFI